MKNTHIKTPRSMDECEFQSWADPFDVDQGPRGQNGETIGIVIAIVALAALVLFVA